MEDVKENVSIEVTDTVERVSDFDFSIDLVDSNEGTFITPHINGYLNSLVIASTRLRLRA